MFKGFLSLDFEPVGKWFEQYTYLRHQGDAEEVDDESSSESEDEVEVEDTPEYLAYLQTLDPKNWKVCLLSHREIIYKTLILNFLKGTRPLQSPWYRKAALQGHPASDQKSL